MFPDETLTVIVGPNAAGKSNILEAIQLLTSASSFRSPQWGECVRWGGCESVLSLEAEGDGRRVTTALTISSAGKRIYQVNGNTKRRLSEVTGVLPCVVFTPDDLRLVKDSAERRRNALDGVGDQLSPSYSSLRTEYDQIVRQRNALLKEERADKMLMETLTQRMVEKGVGFSSHRRRLFGRMAIKLSEAYATLSQEEKLTAVYESSWDIGSRGGADDVALMTEALQIKGAEERARRTTLVGPHRDEIRFLIDDKDARTYASQGQQRTVALAWKLAEVGVITEVGGQSPVLLLDDVMSELDESRRHALASFVGGAAQTFVTTTNMGYFENEMIERARVVTLG